MPLQLIGIGGLGLMLSPAARHLRKADSPAKFLRIHDRGTRDPRRDRARNGWREHGAELVSSFDALVGDGRFDGVIICAGKNGDDVAIFRELLPLLRDRCSDPPFILHLSTVSSRFVQAAHEVCREYHIAYGNYPLTGGPAGAEAATMLILASGDPTLYERTKSLLQALGRPRYFGERVTAGAEVKLMGQFMVFNGLNGISSAAALHAACFGVSVGDPQQSEFFGFLNQGAGGTRQWEVALSKGIRDQVWDEGFMLHHAVVDALYAAQLGLEKGLALYSVMPMIHTAISFAFLLQKYPNQSLATHAIARELLEPHRRELDRFFQQILNQGSEAEHWLQQCVAHLPDRIKGTVKMDIGVTDFKISHDPAQGQRTPT